MSATRIRLGCIEMERAAERPMTWQECETLAVRIARDVKRAGLPAPFFEAAAGEHSNAIYCLDVYVRGAHVGRLYAVADYDQLLAAGKRAYEARKGDA